MPKALNRAVAGLFLFLSIRQEITPFYSVSNSSHAPREGISFAPKNLLSRDERDIEKKTPGLRISWEITTLSTPLIIKVPLGVIKGKSDKNNSCSLYWSVLLFLKLTLTFKGAS